MEALAFESPEQVVPPAVVIPETPVSDEAAAVTSETAVSADAVQTETQETPKQKPQAKGLDSLDAVLRALNEQDEQLKTMKGQIQEMLTTNAALKKGIKQIVSEASQKDEIESELQQARKKLSMLKTFING